MMVYSSASNVVREIKEEGSTTPASATTVMPTSSFCRASPRFSDHLK